MRLPIQVYILAVYLVLTVNGAKNSSKSCAKPYDKMMVCNLMCNLLQDSDANDAIKMLQTKLENLIAVVNKPSPTLPPGKMICLQCFPRPFFRKFQIASVSLLSAVREGIVNGKISRASTHKFPPSCLSSLAHQSTEGQIEVQCIHSYIFQTHSNYI